MKDTKIPILFNNIYRKNTNRYQILYNPYSYKGLLILPNKYLEILRLIDCKNNIKKIYQKAKKIYKNFSEKKFRQFIDNLERYDIINYESRTNYFHTEPGQNKLFDNTLAFWINLTNQCNFRCAYCWIDKKSKRMTKNLIKDLIENIFYAAKNNNINTISFVLAGGEPLLEKELLKYFIIHTKLISGGKYFNSIGTSISIITNGSLINDNFAKFLKLNNVKVAISMDGIGKYHDYTRKYSDGSGTYNNVKKGLTIAVKNNILTNTICTITKNNISNLPSLVNYLQENNIEKSFHFYKKVSNNCKEKLIEYDNEFLKSYKTALKRIYNNPKRKNYNSPFNDKGYKILDTVVLFKHVSQLSCTAGLSFFSINTDGTITDCPSKETNILASIYDNDFLHKIKNKRSEIMKNLIAGNNPFCRKCLWRYTCRGMCSLEKKYVRTRDKCRLIKKLIPYVIELEAERIMKASINVVSKKLN